MKSALLGLALVIVGAVTTGANAATPPHKMSWLAIETAQSYSFIGSTLTLANASQVTTLFTDRPVRLARHIATADFLSVWDTKAARKDPFNAGITTVIDGKLVTATFEITSKPRIEGEALIYDVKVTSGHLPPKGGETSTFIDDIHWNPSGF
jgi:hypothetical protein